MDFPILWVMSICLFPSVSSMQTEVRCNKKPTVFKHIGTSESFYHAWNMTDLNEMRKYNNCASQVLIKSEVPVFLNVLVEWVHAVHLSTRPEMALQMAYDCETHSSCIGAVITLNVTSYPSSRCYACLLPSSSSSSSSTSPCDFNSSTTSPSSPTTKTQLGYMSYSNLIALQLILNMNQLSQIAPSLSHFWLSTTVQTYEGHSGNHQTCVKGCGWLGKCQNKACEQHNWPTNQRHSTHPSSVGMKSESEGRQWGSVELLLAIFITLCIILLVIVALLFFRCISYHRLHYQEPQDHANSTHRDFKKYEKSHRLPSFSASSSSVQNNGLDKCSLWLAHGNYNVSSARRNDLFSRGQMCSPHNRNCRSHGPLPPPPRPALLARPGRILKPTASNLVKFGPSESTALTPLTHVTIPSQASTPACSGSDGQTFSVNGEGDSTTPQSNTDNSLLNNHNLTCVPNVTISRSNVSTYNSLKYSCNPLRRIGAPFEVPPNQFPFENRGSSSFSQSIQSPPMVPAAATTTTSRFHLAEQLSRPFTNVLSS